MSDALLLTSLAPSGDRDRQKRVLRSWIEAGFAVATVNAPEEVTELADGLAGLPEVVVLAARRTAQDLVGKPLPLIVDMLDLGKVHGAGTGAALIGLINDDILLSGPPAAFASLRRCAAAGVVMGRRWDVDGLDAVPDDPAATPAYGYDFALMPMAAAQRLPDQPFCLGMPQWDFWLPLTLLLAGVPVWRQETRLAFHQRHGSAWAGNTMIFAHKLMQQCLGTSPPGGEAGLSAVFFQGLARHLYQTTVAEASRDADGDSLSAVERLAWQHDRFIEWAAAFLLTHAGEVPAP